MWTQDPETRARIEALEAKVGVLIGKDPPAKFTNLAHGFGTNAAAVTITNAATLFAKVTVTPGVTGKFRVTGIVVVSNSAAADDTLSLSLGHGGATIDFTQALMRLPRNSVSTDFTIGLCYTIQAEVGPFPVGVPVELDMFGSIFGIVGAFVVPFPNGASIEVEELPN